MQQPSTMPDGHALLIGGPFHGQVREVSGPTLHIQTGQHVQESRPTGYGGCSVRREWKDYATYLQHGSAPWLYVLEGYEPTADDEATVREWARS
ncbi:MAG: hypothetical protein AAGF31_00505 [Planctomycetota bacterium]